MDASKGGRKVLVDGTARLLRAEPEAGVRHHVGVSIVGIDRVGGRYYKAKLDQEAEIRALRHAVDDRARDAVPHARGAHVRRERRLGVVPRRAMPLQPVDPREVGRVLAETAEAEPSLAITQFAGPEVVSVRELARRWRRGTGSRAVPVRLPCTRSLRAGGLTNPGAWRGSVTFDAWLARMTARSPSASRHCARGLLRLAYGQLGSVAEAEDVVQEAWLRLQRVDADEIRDLKGWLTTRSRGWRSTRCAPRACAARRTSARGCPSRSWRSPARPSARGRPRTSASRCWSCSRACRPTSGSRSSCTTCSATSSTRSRRARRHAGGRAPAGVAGPQGGRGAAPALPGHPRAAARRVIAFGRAAREGDLERAARRSCTPTWSSPPTAAGIVDRGAQADRGRRPGRARHAALTQGRGRPTVAIVDINGMPGVIGRGGERHDRHELHRRRRQDRGDRRAAQPREAAAAVTGLLRVTLACLALSAAVPGCRRRSRRRPSTTASRSAARGSSCCRPTTST